MIRAERVRKLLLFVAVSALVLGVCLHFCLWKSGMFIDEIYTYGLSNSHYEPFIGHGEGEWLEEQRLTREDFLDYLAVTEDERFDFGSVYYNQEIDVHPPLHYWIINLCASLAVNRFSKWIGLIPDLIIYAGTLALLFGLCRELGWEDTVSAVCVLFYGLSQVGLSTMLMIRMYVLMTFFTVLLAWLVLRERRRPSVRTEAGIGLCIFLGLMTQYYFVFYAFFLCALYVLEKLWRKEWKGAARFGLFAFAGVGLMLLCFPAAIRQLTADRLVSGGNAMENLGNLSAWPGRLRYYFGQIRQGMGAGVVCSLLAVMLLIIRSLKKRVPFPKKGLGELMFLVAPAVMTVFVAAVIAPVVEGRYIYNIMPVCALCAGWCLNAAIAERGERDAAAMALVVLCVGITLATALVKVPEYVYDEHRGYNEVTMAHAEDPCVYLTGYYAPVTQDMLQLMNFEDVYVTEDAGSAGLKRYLEEKNSDECVVYVDIDGFWGSGFQADEALGKLMEETGYTASEHLYQYALSDTYLLRR